MGKTVDPRCLGCSSVGFGEAIKSMSVDMICVEEVMDIAYRQSHELLRWYLDI